jgi:pyruvate/2-oxoglutarate dehydrogenase complex dihydrolipoamide dehydrogenase (E3) component
VLVVGAGPAGLAAARMAALHGHAVVLCDQAAEPGGALRLAAKVPGRGELGDPIAFLVAELASLNVETRLNCPLSDALLDDIDPEIAILATGSLPDMPMVKGLHSTGMQVCTVTEVLDGSTQTGSRVIVWGGNQAGLVLADYLASGGRTVIVLHSRSHFGEEMSSNDRYYLRERLNQGRVKLFKHVTVEKILSDGVQCRIDQTRESFVPWDTLVLADRFVALRDAANLLKKRGIETHFIGDAKQPRHLMYAMSEGEEVGRSLS